MRTSALSVCADCGVDTAAIHEWFMVRDDVWHESGVQPDAFLCLACLEVRLGRELCPDDFLDVPMNRPSWPHSPRLRERLPTFPPTVTQAQIDAVTRCVTDMGKHVAQLGAMFVRVEAEHGGAIEVEIGPDGIIYSTTTGAVVVF